MYTKKKSLLWWNIPELFLNVRFTKVTVASYQSKRFNHFLRNKESNDLRYETHSIQNVLSVFLRIDIFLTK